MRTFFCLAFMMFMINQMQGQPAIRQVFSSGANSAKSPSGGLVYNYGQTFYGTYSNDAKNYFITQGFTLNGNYVISSIINDEMPAGMNILIYPNPVKDLINIQQSAESSLLVKIFDLQGKTLYEKVIQDKTTSVDLGFLPKGTYMLFMLDEQNQKRALFKIIKI